MKTVNQLCINSYTVKALDGDSCTVHQGKYYTTTVPEENNDTVTAFTSSWIPVPKSNFVMREEGGHRHDDK